MKARYHHILLQPDESFTCVEWLTSPAKGTGAGFVVHNGCSLVAVIESRGTVYVGDCIHHYRNGEIVFFGPQIPSYWSNDQIDRRKKHHFVTATFDEDFLGEKFLQLPEIEGIRQLLARAHRGLLFPRSVSARATPLLQLASHEKGAKRVALLIEALDVMASARTFKYLISPGFSSELEEDNLKRLSRVCKYVHQSYAGEIRETQAAKLAGLTPTYFSRFFRKSMGRTFMNYVIQVRIGEACRLLTEEDHTIVQIALQAGFNQLSNFNHHFLKLKGMTPREYRREHGVTPSA